MRKLNGGRSTSDQQRSGAWDVMTEFRQWGPVGANGRPMPSKAGAFFDAWLMALKGAGYQVDHRGKVYLEGTGE